MERNTALAEETLQYITDHPEKWDQGSYGESCGTVGCFAFHAVALSGEYRHLRGMKWRNRPGYVVTSKKGAMEVLGLTWEEASYMFGGGNSLEDLQIMVKDFANGDEVRSR